VGHQRLGEDLGVRSLIKVDDDLTGEVAAHRGWGAADNTTMAISLLSGSNGMMIL